MLPALIATRLPNHNIGGMQPRFFHNTTLLKGVGGDFWGPPILW